MVRESVFRQCAFRLSERAGKRRLDSFDIERAVFDAMTMREPFDKVKPVYDAELMQKEPDYAGLLDSMKFNGTHRTDFGGMHWGVTYGVHSKPREKVGERKVTYKSYFTFRPRSGTPEGRFEEIRNFVRLLPRLHEELRPLQEQHSAGIAMKIPGDLLTLLRHPDSLVVHYSDPELAGEIEATVQRLAQEQGVNFDRFPTRAHRGFDFEVPTEHASASSSHSELVSRAVAKRFMAEYDKLEGKPEGELAAWLMQKVKLASSWTPQQMHDYLYGRK